MSASTTMWVIANTKINVCSSMLQKTVKINVREINALKDTEKPVSMEKVANLNLSVNSGIMRKQKQMDPIKYLN